jgi:hypothetical protein
MQFGYSDTFLHLDVNYANDTRIWREITLELIHSS